MYQLINSNTEKVIGWVDEPIYIKLKPETGVYIPAKVEDAQGVAFHSVAYNLSGRDGVGVEDTVVLVEVDKAMLMSQVPELQEQVAAIEDALCEIDMGE